MPFPPQGDIRPERHAASIMPISMSSRLGVRPGPLPSHSRQSTALPASAEAKQWRSWRSSGCCRSAIACDSGPNSPVSSGRLISAGGR